jgi:ABC-type nitrate/sulfonate/bicarbonate transport system substrate-binding protein
MNRKFLLILLVMFVVVVGAVLMLKRRPAETERVVRVGYAPIIGTLPVYIAEENRLFEQAGVKAEFVQLQSANQLMEGLVRGDLDLVPFGGFVPVMNVELADPGKVKIFAGSRLTQEEPFDSLLVLKESPIQKLTDLAGKKVGVFPGSTATNFLKRYLSSKGVATETVEIVQLPAANQLSALYGGSVDALLAFEPNITIPLEEGKVRKLIPESVYFETFNYSPQGVGLISTKFVNEEPELAKKSVDTMNQAYVFMKDQNAAARQIAERRFAIPKTVAEKVGLTHMYGLDTLDKTMVEKYADTLVSLGELKQKPDLSKIFYQP